MSQSPILTAASDFAGLRVNGHNATAREGSDVRTSVFIEREVPSGDRSAPVAQNAGEGACPLRAIGQIAGIGVVGSTFGPIHFGVGAGFVRLGHHLRLSHIAVPGNRVAILTQVGIVKFGDGAPPQVVIVIKNPDLCFKILLGERWSQKLGYEIDLIFLRPDTGGHAPVLIRVDLVLNRYRLYV